MRVADACRASEGRQTASWAGGIPQRSACHRGFPPLVCAARLAAGCAPVSRRSAAAAHENHHAEQTAMTPADQAHRG